MGSDRACVFCYFFTVGLVGAGPDRHSSLPSPSPPIDHICCPHPHVPPCLAAPVAADPAQLERVARLLGKGATLAASCAAADWLLVAAAPERGVSEALAALHGDVLQAMKVRRGCGSKFVGVVCLDATISFT